MVPNVGAPAVLRVAILNPGRKVCAKGMVAETSAVMTGVISTPSELDFVGSMVQNRIGLVVMRGVQAKLSRMGFV